MTSIFTYLTTVLVASSAVVGFNAPDDSSARSHDQSVAIVQTNAENSVTDSNLEEILAEFNRAAIADDRDAMRAIFDKSGQNDAVPNVVKAQMLEALLVAQIKEIAKEGDEAAIKAFCDELLDKALDDPVYAGCALACAKYVAIYSPILGDDFYEKLSQKLRSSNNSKILFAISQPNPPLAPSVSSLGFDQALLEVASGKDRKFYRDQLAKLEDAYKDFNRRASNDQLYATRAETTQKVEEARFKLLREIVLADGDEDSQFFNEFSNYTTRIQFSAGKSNPNSNGLKLDYESALKLIKELEDKGFDQAPTFSGTLRSAKDYIYFEMLSNPFNAALNGSEADRALFITAYRTQLREIPRAVGYAPNFARKAMDAGLREFAAEIARLVEEYQRENPNDAVITNSLAEIKRNLNAKTLNDLVGQKVDFAGINVNFKETSFESFRGKYVFVAFTPMNKANPLEAEKALKEFDNLAKQNNADNVAFVEYIESIGTVLGGRNLNEPDVLKELEPFRAREYPVVAQDLSIRSNVAFDTNYPRIFNDYRMIRPEFALVGPDGVLIDVNPAPWFVQRLLERSTQAANSTAPQNAQ